MPTEGPFGELLAAGPVLLDGAWGTQMQSRGLRPGETPDFWNLDHPDRVEEVARSYVEAGSQIILTNTFRASRIALARHPQVDRIAEVNRAGVEISRRAAGKAARVFASIGPSGRQLITGETDPAELRDAFAEQAEALASAQPDAIVIETMSDLTEARLAIEAARATGLPVVACMAFDSGRKHDRTMMGVTPTQAAAQLSAAGADAVGANCGAGIDEYIPVCAALAAATDRPIWIKPNAGLPQLRGGEVVYPTTSEEFAGKLPALVGAGAHFIGGCCGTDPSFIEAMRSALAG